MTPSVAAPLDLWALLQDAKVVPAEHAANDLDVVKAIEGGLPVRLLSRLLAMEILELVDVSLIMPLRTFQHRKAHRTRLTTDESDRVVRIAQLTAAASDALGARDVGPSRDGGLGADRLPSPHDRHS